MPDYPPPPDYQGTPHRCVLPAGQRLWLVHSQKKDATEFTVPRTDIRTPGSRFDGTYGDPYKVCYAALDAGTALAEVVLRGASITNGGARIGLRTTIARMRATAIETVTDLSLVDLCDGPTLASAAQDGWLVTADCADYPMTRRWGSWIRSKAKWADGFLWATGGSAKHRSVVLFEDRCRRKVFAEDPIFTMDLDDEQGINWVNSWLLEFHTQIELPRRK